MGENDGGKWYHTGWCKQDELHQGEWNRHPKIDVSWGRMLTSPTNAPSQVQESPEMVSAMVAKEKETKSNLEGKTEPRTVSEALRQSNRVGAPQWLGAVNKEIEGLATVGHGRCET